MGIDTCKGDTGLECTCCNVLAQTCEIENSSGIFCLDNAYCSETKCNSLTQACDAEGTGEPCFETSDCFACQAFSCIFGGTEGLCSTDTDCQTYNVCTAQPNGANTCDTLTCPQEGCPIDDCTDDLNCCASGTKICADGSEVCTENPCPTYCTFDGACTETADSLEPCDPENNMCPTFTHNECNTENCKCEVVSGMGIDTCKGDTGLECTCCGEGVQAQSCVLEGSSLNWCFDDTFCSDIETYNVCSIQTCESVGCPIEGCPPDECQEFTDCCEEIPTLCPNGMPVCADDPCPSYCTTDKQCSEFAFGNVSCDPLLPIECLESHNICNELDQCEVVSGLGFDECFLDLDCTHTVCGYSQGICSCTEESGSGFINECSEDLDCESSPICAKKTECIDNQCVMSDCLLEGDCNFLCFDQEACCSSGNHTECVNGQCVCLIGEGEDRCQTDTNCSYHTECNFEFESCYIVDEIGINECSLYNSEIDCEINTPPSITNLRADEGNYCTEIPYVGIAYFSWTYQDLEDGSQKNFKFQVDDNSDFSSPEVDRFFDRLTSGFSSNNEQMVYVKNQPTMIAGDFIKYGIPYYWRVMVQEYKKDLSSDWVYYDGLIGTTDPNLKEAYIYGYVHPAPIVDFNILPETAVIDEDVYFGDMSVCYTESGPYACKGLPYGYTWTFGDNSTSNKSGDIFHTYTSDGIFTSTLQVCDEINCCSSTKNISVRNETSTELPKFKEIPPY